jgi:hypothetical protein
MFFQQKLRCIQEAKNRLVLCGDLRRHLTLIEVQTIRDGAGRTLSNLTLGLTVAEQIFDLLRGRKVSRQ